MPVIAREPREESESWSCERNLSRPSGKEHLSFAHTSSEVGEDAGEAPLHFALHGFLHRSLHLCGEAKSKQTHDLHGPQTMQNTRPNYGPRRERPHPWTHRRHGLRGGAPSSARGP